MALDGLLEFRGRLRSADNTLDEGLAVQLGLDNGIVSLRSHDLELGEWSTSNVDVRHRGGRVFTLTIEEEPWIFVPESPSYFIDVGFDLLKLDPDSGFFKSLMSRPVAMWKAVTFVILASSLGAGAMVLVARPDVDLWASFGVGLVSGGLLAWISLAASRWISSMAEDLRVEAEEGESGDESLTKGRMLMRRALLVLRALGQKFATILRTGRVGERAEGAGANASRGASRVGVGVTDGLTYQWRSSVEGLDVLTRFLPPEDVRRSVEKLSSRADSRDADDYESTSEDAVVIDLTDEGQPETDFQPDVEEDDLTAIRGIGPASLKILNELGYRTYLDLAVLGQQDIERINAALGPMGSRMQREDWVGQAAQLFFEKRRELSSKD